MLANRARQRTEFRQRVSQSEQFLVLAEYVNTDVERVLGRLHLVRSRVDSQLCAYATHTQRHTVSQIRYEIRYVTFHPFAQKPL